MLNSHPTVTNNIIAKNVAGVHAGGIRIWNTVAATRRLPLINNTICYNRAPEGAGIYTVDAEVILMNSIVWHDTGGSDISGSGGDFRIAFSNTEEEWVDTGNVCVPPGFVDTLYCLPDTSHCIGAGTNSFQLDGVWYNAPPRCIYGGPRPDPALSRSDIGACENGLALPVGIEEQPNVLPTSYALDQNYPNPFNPSTMINYQLPLSNQVTLKVYDILGREVATLVDGLQEPGYKSVEFDASSLASGVYLYQLRAGTFTGLKKMLVLK